MALRLRLRFRLGLPRIRLAQPALALALAWSSAAPALAQYTGPSATPAYRNVGEVLKNPVDDAKVAFTGHLLRKVSNDKYIFSDGTGEIRVDIDDKHFPPTPIDEKTKVQIRGEVEKDFLESPEIDVESLAVVP
ncbi:MAG: NirD/YgiW/YdeI family stress tolerance protein [Comamonadaceae bacterium]|nr:MAG: NirD/YgiW/YdeI family stress tolerance protein [Comamonadaceae bacterium]